MAICDITDNRTAILLFSLTSTKECEVKSVSPCTRLNLALWTKFKSRTEKILQKTGFPYFISDESTQVGHTFGEKLSHAVENVYNSGYDNIVIVGSDCPGLLASSIKKAAEKLLSHALVVGPDSHGGAHIIGLQKIYFNSEQFTHLPWQTDKILHGLTASYVWESIFVLPKLHDINTLHDVRFYISTYIQDQGFKQLLILVFNRPSVIRFIVTFQSTLLQFTFYNKGSPTRI